VLCVPYDQTETVLVAARAKQAAEEKQMAATLAGTSDRSYIDKTLAKIGCEMP